MNAVHLLAPAKVNLRLRVLGRRADGFHALDTVMLAVDLCDRVSVVATGEPGVSLVVHGADLPLDERNLAVQAARGVLALAGERARGVRLRLRKHIPVEAGLGGGSSDAAAAVLGTCRALGLELGPSERSALLAELGSDCPFFLGALDTGCARCTGRGEIVAPLPAPALVLGLVVPATRCPTAAVYAALGAPPTDGGGMHAEELVRLGAEDLRAQLGNELEPAAFRALPELARWRELLDGAGLGHFRLAGSGSAFFGLFASTGEADAARERVAQRARAAGLGLRASYTVRTAGAGVLPG